MARRASIRVYKLLLLLDELLLDELLLDEDELEDDPLLEELLEELLDELGSSLQILYCHAEGTHRNRRSICIPSISISYQSGRTWS